MICLLRLRVNTTQPWMISSIWCYHSRGLQYCSSGDIDACQQLVYMTVGPRPILLLLLLAGLLPDGLYAAALLLLHYFRNRYHIVHRPRCFQKGTEHWTTYLHTMQKCRAFISTHAKSQRQQRNMLSCNGTGSST